MTIKYHVRDACEHDATRDTRHATYDTTNDTTNDTTRTQSQVSNREGASATDGDKCHCLPRVLRESTY